MFVRGVRGATTVLENTKPEIVKHTAELLERMIDENNIDSENIASIIFTTTSDVYNEFPAVAAREILSLHSVPLLNMQEIDNPNGLKSCIRILIHWNTEQKQSEIKHVYLNEATALRTDLK
jgi:chorismate mutase